MDIRDDKFEDAKATDEYALRGDIPDHLMPHANFIGWYLEPMHRAYMVKKQYPFNHFRKKESKKITVYIAHRDTDWAIDSAASINLTNNLDLFTDLKDVRVNIKGAENSCFVATKKGTIMLTVRDKEGRLRRLVIKDAYYAADVQCNFVVSSSTDQGELRHTYGSTGAPHTN